MAISTVLRKYRMHDSELMSIASYLIINLEQDIDDLSTYGLTQVMIDELIVIYNQFKNIQIDKEIEGSKINATQEKNNIIEDVKKEIRNMILRCRLKWGLNSIEERSLEIKRYSNYSDDNLLVASRRVHSQMCLYLPELLQYGLTQQILDNYEALNIQYENALNNKKDKSSLRIKSTEDRINLGNQLYYLVARYANIGKKYYQYKNPVKYKRYIIYNTSKQKRKNDLPDDNINVQ